MATSGKRSQNPLEQEYRPRPVRDKSLDQRNGLVQRPSQQQHNPRSVVYAEDFTSSGPSAPVSNPPRIAASTPRSPATRPTSRPPDHRRNGSAEGSRAPQVSGAPLQPQGKHPVDPRSALALLQRSQQLAQAHRGQIEHLLQLQAAGSLGDQAHHKRRVSSAGSEEGRRERLGGYSSDEHERSAAAGRFSYAAAGGQTLPQKLPSSAVHARTNLNTTAAEAASMIESESMPSLLATEDKGRYRQYRQAVGVVRGGGAIRGHACRLERLDRVARKQQEQVLGAMQQQQHQQLDVEALQDLCRQQERLSVVRLVTVS